MGGIDIDEGKWGMKWGLLTRSFRWFELPLLLCLLLVVFCSGIETVSFHSDESQWIATSSVFEAFIKGNFDSPLWNEPYWNLTQPQLARYTIALGRLAGGYHVRDLNRPWDHGLRGCLKSLQWPNTGGYHWRHGTPKTVPDRPD